jgi:hypothetical protein
MANPSIPIRALAVMTANTSVSTPIFFRAFCHFSSFSLSPEYTKGSLLSFTASTNFSVSIIHLSSALPLSLGISILTTHTGSFIKKNN